jgi:hypothetical protein
VAALFRATERDSKAEADETVTPDLFGPGGDAMLLGASGLGAIPNDDR